MGLQTLADIATSQAFKTNFRRTSDIVFREDLYPRFKPDLKLIQAYAKNKLPATPMTQGSAAEVERLYATEARARQGTRTVWTALMQPTAS